MSRRRRSLTGWVLALGLLWLSVQVGLFFFGPRNSIPTPHHGVRYANDTKDFLAAAEMILAGDLPVFPKSKSFYYLSYELFTAFFIGSGLGALGLVIAQALATSLAAWCLWRLASRLYDTRTGLLAAFLYVAYADIHAWNFYVLADSLFISMMVVTLFLLVEARGFWRTAAAALAVVVTSVIKPQGVVLLASAGAYLLYLLWKAKRYLTLAAVSCVLLAAATAGVLLLSNFPGRVPLAEHYAKGTVIVNYSPSDMPVPEALKASVAGLESPLAQTLIVAERDPGHLLRLAGSKLWYFFSHTRPYYSPLHNYLLLAILLPTYALAALGLVPASRYPAGKLLLIAVCLLQPSIVTITYVSRDGRYLLPLLPIIFIFAAVGALRAWDTVAASTGGRPLQGTSRL